MQVVTSANHRFWVQGSHKPTGQTATQWRSTQSHSVAQWHTESQCGTAAQRAGLTNTQSGHHTVEGQLQYLTVHFNNMVITT
jgi:hypothetical protein